MADSALEIKAHELLGQLEPAKLAAVVHLLEVMVHDDHEPVTGEGTAAAFTKARHGLRDAAAKVFPWKRYCPSLG